MKFQVWAPIVKNLEIEVDGALYTMRKKGDYFFADIDEAKAGSRYYFILNGKKRADPCSFSQPEGVFGPSEVIDFSQFQWDEQNYVRPPLEKAIFYELHTGTFTKEGTFDAAIEKLPYLKELGVTVVELMPVATFSGRRNWGYDGVFLFAPASCYGGPEGLKNFVQAAHKIGLAVVLDVVYNHFGPEGNTIDEFGPYLTDKYTTPWGGAVNFDDAGSDAVRKFVIDNALMWFENYHFDGLRLDAVQEIFDNSPQHIFAELKEKTAGLGWLIAESDLNDPKVVESPEKNGWGLDAQWADDFHHALHVVTTRNSHGYLMDFGKVEDLAKAIAQGFVYDGKFSSFRKRFHGTCVKGFPPEKFIFCTQNHDQVANAYLGERPGTDGQKKFMLFILMMSPGLPLLFMGQERGTSSPFHFFTDFKTPKLAKAVTEGRKKEHEWDYIPDPQAYKTFTESKIDWSQGEEEALWTKELIALRHTVVKERPKVSFSEENRWLVLVYNKHIVTANLSEMPQEIPLPNDKGNLIFYTGDELNAPWSGAVFALF